MRPDPMPVVEPGAAPFARTRLGKHQLASANAEMGDWVPARTVRPAANGVPRRPCVRIWRMRDQANCLSRLVDNQAFPLVQRCSPPQIGHWVRLITSGSLAKLASSVSMPV